MVKRIVNGLKYDTETATEIAQVSNGLGESDHYSMSETMYKTTKGNWFLYGEGGAESKYSVAMGNSRCGSEAIIPMSPEEAFEWLCSNDKPGSAETHFPEMVQEA